MTNYYIPIIYIVPLISVDGQASPRLFIAPEIRHEKISYAKTYIVKTLNATVYHKNSEYMPLTLRSCRGLGMVLHKTLDQYLLSYQTRTKYII